MVLPAPPVLPPVGGAGFLSIRGRAETVPVGALRERTEEYSRECTRQHILPITLETATRCLQPNGCCSSASWSTPTSSTASLPKAVLGDRHVAAWCAAGLLDDLREVRLRDAAVSDAGAAALASRLGDGVELLDLDGNALGTRGVAALMGSSMYNLETLVLSRNGLGDCAVSRLCDGLAGRASPHLRTLSLAENQISRGGRSLGGLLQCQHSLNFLDLHWNLLTGDGALGLFEGLVASSAAGGTLQRLDVSWNCLGNTGAAASAGALAEALRRECPLVHLDLSYNHYKAQECGIIGEGLRDNHTLLGLHLVGNAADVDSDGFVVPLVAPEPPAALFTDLGLMLPKSPKQGLGPAAASAPGGSASPRRLLGEDGAGGAARRLISDQERAAIRATFASLDADRSGAVNTSELGAAMRSIGLALSPEEVAALVARNDADGSGELDVAEFTALMESLILAAHRKEAENDKARKLQMHRDRSSLEARTTCWICESWQPVELSWAGEASAVWAFTSLDNYQRATKMVEQRDGHWTCDKVFPPGQVAVILQVDHRLSVLPGLPTATLPEAVPLVLRTADELPEAHEAPTLSIAEVSFIELGAVGINEPCGGARRPARAVVHDDPENPGGFCVAPRITETEHRAKKAKSAWRFAESMFAPWKFESKKLHTTMLEHDIKHAKGERFLKQQEDIGEVAAFFGSGAHYSAFLRLYRRCAAASTSGTSAFGVSMTVASEILASADVVDEGCCRLADIDTMYIASRVRDKGADKQAWSVRPADTLFRHQFFEFLLRVAQARYVKSGEASGMGDALNLLFVRLAPKVERAEEAMRAFHAEFHTEDCESILKDKESFLRSLYQCRSGRFAKPGEEPWMCTAEFEEVLLGSDAFNEAFPQRDAQWAFQLAMQAYPDELFDLRYSQMSFLEFLHGLGAAAFLRGGAAPLAARLEDVVRGLVGSQLFMGFLRVLK